MIIRVHDIICLNYMRYIYGNMKLSMKRESMRFNFSFTSTCM